MSDPRTYCGDELALFRFAENWKRYLRDQLRPYVAGSVLEVGAGIGSTTRALSQLDHSRWICLEPDPALGADLRAAFSATPDQPRPEVVVGTTDVLGCDDRYDTILYVDVLEHIRDDHEELRRAAAHLRAGGHLIVVAPAHGWLYSPFDAAIGHHRRYTRRTLVRLTPAHTTLVCSRYLDSIGIAASLANRILLRSSTPTLQQIQTWDRVMVPVSRLFDRVLRYGVGKSVLAIWKACV